MNQNNPDWIASYHARRLGVTNVGQSTSEPLLVTCVVPQGPILGTLFFLFFTDLPLSNPDIVIRLYADDTATTMSAEHYSEIEMKSQLALNNVSQWINANRPSLTCAKSKVIYFGTPQQVCKTTDINVDYNQYRPETAHEYKYL